jgi:hypothetical protein
MKSKRLVNVKEKLSNDVLRIEHSIARYLVSKNIIHPKYPEGQWAFISKGALRSKVNDNRKKLNNINHININKLSQNYQDDAQTMIRFEVSSGKVNGWRKSFNLLTENQ